MSAPPARPEWVAIQPGVATHHLDDHHAVVALGGGVEPVDRVGRDLHRGVEPERVVGRRQVVVDRLRHPDHLRAVGARASRRRRACLRRRSRSARRSARARSVSSTRATPSSVPYGFVRDDPRIVPPRGRIPRVDASVRSTPRPRSRRASRGGSRARCGRRPLHPCARCARMTAFSPGQSPPPVSTPILMPSSHVSCRRPALASPGAVPGPLRPDAGSVSMMTRKTTLAHLGRATEPLLQPDETFLTGCAVWMADQRPRVPLVFTGRAIYLLAITTDRLLVFDTPRRGRPLLEADLLLQRRHDALELVRVRGHAARCSRSASRPHPERVVILEFRPRDRAVGPPARRGPARWTRQTVHAPRSGGGRSRQ